MMAQTVTSPSSNGNITAVSHYPTGLPDDWGDNSNFNFTSTDGKIYTCVLKNVTAENIWFRIKKNGTQWGPESSSAKDLVLTGEYQPAYANSTSKSFLIKATIGQTITITWDNDNNKIKYEATTPGGGGTDTPTTPTTNPLKGRVYTQGYYLAGNFFNFSENKENKVTYDDAVFKFQQQKNDTINKVVYAVYKVEIPASLTARAQVMSVDEFGKPKKVYGPGYEAISRTNPGNGATTDLKDLTASTTFEGDKNFWDIKSRNESETEYSDGMYEVYIYVNSSKGEPTMWKFKHIGGKRVAFFISDAKNATAMPVYDTYKYYEHKNEFSNRFYASVNLSTEHSYYVISNYIMNGGYITDKTKSQYGTIAPAHGNAVSSPTTNKLFLLGNGGYVFDTEHNLFSPNEGPMKPSVKDQGSRIIEYNCSNGTDAEAKLDTHLGICGQVLIRGNAEKQIYSVSMVGDAIPGTVNKDDGTWDYASTAANMTYDETERCYKVTLVTKVDDGEKKFRFVGNHKKDFNWYEDSKDVASMMAKTPYDGDGAGHAATSYDPNKVNYTDNGLTENTEADWNIIWNRPAGRWTVRLFFYTYNDDGNNPKTNYYYTISANRELELRDFENVVYKDVNNKREILLRGDYKYFRSWSAKKAWKISKDVDIFVVNGMTEGTDGKAKFTLKKVNADPTNTYNVIPSNTGVILATRKTAADIAGGAEVFERASLTEYNTMVIPMEEYNPTTATTSTDYTETNFLKPLVEAQVVPTMEHTTYNNKEDDYYNYLFGFYHANKGTGTTDYLDNQFLLGFWISNGKGAFYSNSAYLPIAAADVEKMKLGVSYDDFGPNSEAKKVPALFFDFANVDGTTGIDEVVNTTVKNHDGKYYTLSGQQVEKPTAGGVYIHNGKKFVVK